MKKLLNKTIRHFKLPIDFVNEYRNKKVEFGFGGLGEFVYYRSYSREGEDWVDTIQRVVEGTFDMQIQHINKINRGLYWDEKRAQESAQIMFDKIFNMKFLPSGRGLYAMGTPITYEAEKYAALNSCAFVSTENILNSKPFAFLMDLLFLGVGVGFDTRGKNKIMIRKPVGIKKVYQITDDREGWVQSLILLLDSYFIGLNEVHFDYSLIRKKGESLKTFGGIAAGPEPLKRMHEDLREILDQNIGQKISSRVIVDIFNIIAKVVISGNIRRAAEIALGDLNDIDFLDLKNYEKYPERLSHGWLSNNSVIAKVGDDYTNLVDRIKENGEPGIFWLDNAQKYSRMNDKPDYKDFFAVGCNPCVEQTLESYEMCCLVETFPDRHDDLEEFLDTLKYAFMYGKTVTLGESHWEETNEILRKNRRIGVSMSGIAQFIGNKGLKTLENWCEEGYKYIQECDEKISEKFFKVNKSIKTTSVKPSGTVSILAGATPGTHFPESKHYIRRVRLLDNSDLIKDLIKAGYTVEPDVNNKENIVVEFPVLLEGDNIKINREVSMKEKLELTAFMQEFWSDNQVSCTITFDRDNEGDQILDALNEYQHKLKGISFLPYCNNNKEKPFPQMPYEEITEEEYFSLIKNLKELKFDKENGVEEEEKFCSNDKCNTLL